MSKLQLPWPVSTPVGINQAFGVNGEYYRRNGIDILGHNGLDLRTYHGQPVYASHSGWAKYETDKKGGHGVTIRSRDKALLFGVMSFYKTGYWHLCDYNQEPLYASPIPHDGKEHFVDVGDIIGFADNTGLSTGDHLHFFLKPIAQDKKGNWYNTRQNNGYGGSVDPSFYMMQVSAPEHIKIGEVTEATEKALIYLQAAGPGMRETETNSLAKFFEGILTSLKKR